MRMVSRGLGLGRQGSGPVSWLTCIEGIFDMEKLRVSMAVNLLFHSESFQPESRKPSSQHPA